MLIVVCAHTPNANMSSTDGANTASTWSMSTVLTEQILQVLGSTQEYRRPKYSEYLEYEQY